MRMGFRRRTRGLQCCPVHTTGQGVRPLPWSICTDGLGEYRFAVAKTGAYNIQAVNLTKMSRLLVTGISVTGDTTRVSIAILSAPGADQGHAPRRREYRKRHAYVPGSGVVSRARGTGDSIILDSCSGGGSSFRQLCPGKLFARLPSFDTTCAFYPVIRRRYIFASWRYARSIFLNTTSSGAWCGGLRDRFSRACQVNAQQLRFYAGPDDRRR